jgi:hypothetical protein
MTAGANTQPGRSPNWPLATLVVAHASLVVLGLVLVLLFGQRLPGGVETMVGTWAAFLVILLGLIAAYIVRTAWVRGEAVDQVAERVLPRTFLATGALFSMMLSVIADNLDVPADRNSFPSPLGMVVIFTGVYLFSIVGRRLGAGASARRFRLARPARRLSWMATVHVDGNWRIKYGLVYGAVLLLLLGWVTASQGFPVFLAVWGAAIWWVGVGMGPTAVVFVTETGVRVVGRSLESAPGWVVPVSDIDSVRVVDATPGLPVPLWARRCVLRSGPALEVTARDGSEYLVSLPSADEAAAVLDGLLSPSSTSAR